MKASRNKREGYYCGRLKLFIIVDNKVTCKMQSQHVRTGTANKLCALRFGGRKGVAKGFSGI